MGETMTVLGTKDILLFGRTIDGVDLPIKVTSGGLVVVSGGSSGASAHSALTGLGADDHTQYLLVSGGRALSANWFAGPFKISVAEIISGAGIVSLGRISGLTLESTIATGTPPLVVASTTKVSNLNADLLDDQTGSFYLDRTNHTGTQLSTTISDFNEAAQDTVGGALSGSPSISFVYDDAGNKISANVSGAGLYHGSLIGLTNDDHTGYLLANGTRALTGNWLTSTGATEIQFRSTPQRVYSTSLNTLDIDAGTVLNFRASGGIVGQVVSGSVTLSGAASLRLRDSSATINSPVTGTLALSGSTLTIVGVAGDITLGDSTLRTMYPQTMAKIDLGKTANYFNAGYFTSLNISGLIAQYNGISTVANGVASEYAKVDTLGLTANVASTSLYSVPSAGAGLYRVSSLVVETIAASVSSTLPNLQIVYVDNDMSGTVTINATPILGVAGIGQTGALTANTIGTTATGVIMISSRASTTVSYQTVNYASSAAGMAYALHIVLEKV